MFVCLFVCSFARVLFLLSLFVSRILQTKQTISATLNMGQGVKAVSPTGSSSFVNTRTLTRARERERKKERRNKKNVRLRFISVAIREGGS